MNKTIARQKELSVGNHNWCTPTTCLFLLRNSLTIYSNINCIGTKRS